MSTKEETKDAEPKIDEATGLVEGLDPGTSWTDQSPEARSELIPLSHATRLVGLNDAEIATLYEEEETARAKALKDEEDATAKAEKTSTSKSSHSS